MSLEEQAALPRHPVGISAMLAGNKRTWDGVVKGDVFQDLRTDSNPAAAANSTAQAEVTETRECGAYLQGKRRPKLAHIDLEAKVIDVEDQIAQLFEVDEHADLSLWMLQPAAEGQDQGEVQVGAKLQVCAAGYPLLPMGP